jgi:hypothetical protein
VVRIAPAEGANWAGQGGAMITITQLQQFLFCAAWMWPAGVMLSGGSSNVKDVEAAMFWLFVWIICGIRLFSKKRWPFNAAKKQRN